MKNRFLTIIASCDNTGYTHVEFYKSNTKDENLTTACRHNYCENNRDYKWYLSRGLSITIDLNDLESYNFIKNGDDCLIDYNEYNKKIEKEEREELKRLKKKYGD
jgi:hypothetical protein